MPSIRCTLRYREKGRWIRIMGSFRSFKEAREHAQIIGANTYEIRRLKTK